MSQAAFTVFWLGFTAVWTAGAVGGGAPLVLSLFSAPFWGVGVMMLLNLCKAIFAEELLVLSAGSQAGAGSLSLGIEVFGWPLKQLHLEVVDLQGSPIVDCDGARCQLLF